MWYRRTAKRDYKCLWCQETIDMGHIHIHGDRPNYVIGKHEERGFYFHEECFFKMKDKFGEQFQE